MNYLVNFFFSLSLTAPLPKVGDVRFFTACIDERPWIPYTNPDREKPGNMQILVYNTSRDLQVRVDIEALPWKRCLESVRMGRIDAVIGASDVPYVRQLAEFPTLADSATTDTSRSLGTARIMLVKRRGSSVDWNGRTLAHLAKPVGTAMGTYAMKTAVQQYGGVADDSAHTDSQNLKKLIQDRVDLMAGYEFDLKVLIRASYSDRVSVLPIPLAESPYFLAFSKRFYANRKSFAENFWNNLSNFPTNSISTPLLRKDLTVTTHTP